MTSTIRHVAVLGGGSFGTAIANILADNGHHVSLWMRNEDDVRHIRTYNENRRYMPGYKLNPAINPTTDLEASVTDAQIIFLAVPSTSVPEIVERFKGLVSKDTVLISTTKGIRAEGFLLMSQILRQKTNSELIGVLSGPNLAKEIMARNLTGTVIASESAQVRSLIQETLSCAYFRVYANSDIFGVELGGALKNIYAITAGMASALGMGENTKSMLITRSLAEMSRFAAKLGANPLSFLGLAGVGDLFVTCTSPLSRNFQVGLGLAKGLPLDQVLDELGGTAEGVNTTRLVKHKADELNVYMPLVQGLYEILFNQGDLQSVIKKLMLGEQNTDVEFILPGKHSTADEQSTES